MKHRRKSIIILLLIFTMCISINSYAQETPLEKGYVKTEKDILNLRELPSLQSNILVKLRRGSVITILDKTGNEGWYKVLYNGEEGYVSSEYVVISEKELDKYELVAAAVMTARNSSENRNFNMAKACETINCLTLKPGEIFQWYGENGVGPANKENGYKQAPVVMNKKSVMGYGGGVCQVSTALYNCIYSINIEPKELHHHSLPSSYVEKGMDATVSYSSDERYRKDFIFENSKEYTILFEAYSDEGQVIVLCYKVLNQE